MLQGKNGTGVGLWPGVGQHDAGHAAQHRRRLRLAQLPLRHLRARPALTRCQAFFSSGSIGVVEAKVSAQPRNALPILRKHKTAAAPTLASDRAL